MGDAIARNELMSQNTPLIIRIQPNTRMEKVGSAQEFRERRILGCFLESDEFRLGYRHPLRLQEQIAQILVAPTAS